MGIAMAAVECAPHDEYGRVYTNARLTYAYTCRLLRAVVWTLHTVRT
jgi:hypothetical protein